MVLSEWAVPVLSGAWAVGLTYVIMRNFSRVIRALLEALATIVALFGRDDATRRRGLDALDKLTGWDGDRNGPDEGPSDDDSPKHLPSLPKP